MTATATKAAMTFKIRFQGTGHGARKTLREGADPTLDPATSRPLGRVLRIAKLMALSIRYCPGSA
jgi:hypothetical protein